MGEVGPLTVVRIEDGLRPKLAGFFLSVVHSTVAGYRQHSATPTKADEIL
jgi:hypothetical protein